MEVGGQFDNARSRSVGKTEDGACRQAISVAQLGVGDGGIEAGHMDGHGLSGKIPGAVETHPLPLPRGGEIVRPCRGK